MDKITDKKRVKGIVILFVFTYMVSYITRINYGAIISEMASATGFSKSMLSIALTGSFITYGAGQVISGIYGDRVSPKKLVMYGLCATVLMNLFIPFCSSPYKMLIVWSINGFAQSFMWPPIVKIMTSILTDYEYNSAVTKVSWGSSFGTIAVYLISPLLISLFNWQSVFFVSAFLGFFMIFVWNRYACDAKSEKSATEEKCDNKIKIFSPILLGIMTAIIFQGMLRDGVTTWMPSYIAETYKLSNEISILTGVILPLFSIVCFNFATKLYTKKINNPLSCAGVFFLGGMLASALLFLTTGKNAGLSVIMTAILTGCMHGVNLLLICMIPKYFKNTGKVSTISGILNSCTYIGSAISTYGVALLSETYGWNITILIWGVIALSGTVICFFGASLWDKYKENQLNNMD